MANNAPKCYGRDAKSNQKERDTLAKKVSLVDLATQAAAIEKIFPLVSVLDETGEIVNPDLKPDLDDTQLKQLMADMLWARVVNDRFTTLAKQGRLGFFAPNAGQEASQLASQMVFTAQDFLLPGYRDVPQLVKHGLPLAQAILWSRGHVAGNQYPADFNALPPQIIIGAQIIQTTGVALGMKLRNEAAVAYTYTGDGGSSQGDFYEGINFAGSFNVPAVFYVQNNGYAISTERKVQTKAATLAQKAVAAGILGFYVDGMDPLAVYVVSKYAKDYALAGNGPVLIETVTSRFGPHSLSGDDPKRYRDQASFEFWDKKDPLIRMRHYLTKLNLWDETSEVELVLKFEEEIRQALKQADEVPPQKVSDFITNMFEHPTANLQEQLAYYQAKEENHGQ